MQWKRVAGSHRQPLSESFQCRHGYVEPRIRRAEAVQQRVVELKTIAERDIK